MSIFSTLQCMENGGQEATRLTLVIIRQFLQGRQSGEVICKMPYEFVRADQTNNHRPGIKQVDFLTALVAGSLRSKYWQGIFFWGLSPGLTMARLSVFMQSVWAHGLISSWTYTSHTGWGPSIMTSLDLKHIRVFWGVFLVHVCSCMSELICVSIHVHVCDTQRLISGVILQIIVHLVSFRQSLSGLQLASSRLTAQWAQESLCVSASLALGLQRCVSMFRIFVLFCFLMWFLGLKFRSICVCGKHLAHMSYLLAL